MPENIKTYYCVLAHADRDLEIPSVMSSTDPYFTGESDTFIVSKVIHTCDTEEEALQFISDLFDKQQWYHSTYETLSIKKMYTSLLKKQTYDI
jgi:hypothetical protein